MTDNDSLDELRTRLDRLDACEQIKNLKHRYAAVCDNGYDGAAFADLFTDNATWESNTFGSITGKHAIEEFIDGIGRTEFSWAVHYMNCLDITLGDGTSTATGVWQLLQLSTRISSGQPEPILATALYHDTLTSVGGRWLFDKVSVTFHHVCDIRSGWGPTLMPADAQ